MPHAPVMCLNMGNMLSGTIIRYFISLVYLYVLKVKFGIQKFSCSIYYIFISLFLMVCMQWVLIERDAVPRLCDWAAVHVRHALPGRERSAPGAHFPLAAQYSPCSLHRLLAIDRSSIVAMVRYTCRWPRVAWPGSVGAASSRRLSASWASSFRPSFPVRLPNSRARCRHGRLRFTRNSRFLSRILTF